MGPDTRFRNTSFARHGRMGLILPSALPLFLSANASATLRAPHPPDTESAEHSPPPTSIPCRESPFEQDVQRQYKTGAASMTSGCHAMNQSACSE